MATMVISTTDRQLSFAPTMPADRQRKIAAAGSGISLQWTNVRLCAHQRRQTPPNLSHLYYGVIPHCIWQRFSLRGLLSSGFNQPRRNAARSFYSIRQDAQQVTISRAQESQYANQSSCIGKFVSLLIRYPLRLVTRCGGKRTLNSLEQLRVHAAPVLIRRSLNLQLQFIGHSERVTRSLVSISGHGSIVDVSENLYKESN